MTDTVQGAPFLERIKNPHDVPDGGPRAIDPLVEVPDPPRRSAAEEARTILAGTNVATLASLTSDGAPWASIVTYGTLGDGSPVLCVSRLALHGRNLAADRRASVAVSAPLEEGTDPGDTGRVTVAGAVEEPEGDELESARSAYHDAVDSAASFTGYGDFTFWVLRPERIRWVGGFGRMSSATVEQFAAASPDPAAPHAAYAVRHMNEDHADALLAIARAFSGHTDATAASCLRADRYGLDLGVTTPRGSVAARVGFAAPIEAADGLRAATVELTRSAHAALAQ